MFFHLTIFIMRVEVSIIGRYTRRTDLTNLSIELIFIQNQNISFLNQNLMNQYLNSEYLYVKHKFSIVQILNISN